MGSHFINARDQNKDLGQLLINPRPEEKNAQLVVIIETNSPTGYWISWPPHSTTEEYTRLVDSYWETSVHGTCHVYGTWERVLRNKIPHTKKLNKKILIYKRLSIIILSV